MALNFLHVAYLCFELFRNDLRLRRQSEGSIYLREVINL